MTTTKFQSDILKRIGEALNNLPKERLRYIVEQRFGLKDGQKRTLEEIGQRYNITRERVRQIEADAFRVLNERQNLLAFKPIFDFLDRIFEEHNYLIGEERLLRLATDISEPHPSRSALLLVLTIGKPYQRFNESDKFYPYWATKKQVIGQAEKIVNYLIEYFNKHNQPFLSSEVLNIVYSKHKDVPSAFIQNVVDISKDISENIFGEMGLSNWSDISPRGVRDKAYLVLKRETEPRHFTEITNLINKVNFSSRQAHPQTVHNELIKDDRFVLVGRGLYALRDWGYEPGVVKDVIAKILSDAKKALTKEEIVSAVLKTRCVKSSTIIINLQNNKEFQRLGDGKYILA